MTEAIIGLAILFTAIAIASWEAHHLYGFLGLLASPLAALYYFFLSLKKRVNLLADLRARFGFIKLTVPQGSLWLHGASVGEIQLAGRLLAEMDRNEPGLPVVVSAMTAAGLARAQRLGPRVRALLHPLDLPVFAARLVNRLRPRLLVLLEGDYWLLTLLHARLLGARIVVINARVSEKAFARMGWVRFYYRACFRLVDEFLPRSEADRDRLAAFGVKPAQLGLIADMKFDLAPPPPSPLPAGGPLFVAASVYAREFDPVLVGYAEAKKLEPKLRLLFAPRRAEEFSAAWEKISALAAARGWGCARRSECAAADGRAAWPDSEIFLLDGFGELSGAFSGACAAFIGGSLFPHGGQNPLEAAAAGVPVLYGPSMENFARAIEQLKAAGAAIAVSRETLGATLCGLMENREALSQAGSRAAALVASNRGTTEKIAARVLDYWGAAKECGPALPQAPRRPLPLLPALLLSPAGALWRFIMVLWSGVERRGTRLDKPVISVGNLTLGGTGKTPAVIWLARRLQKRGKKVAILSRGYGRKTRKPKLVSTGKGIYADPDSGGDEPLLLAMRMPGAIVAVAGDRRQAADIAASYNPDVYLLDDGFQHRKVARDLNLCLLDPAAPLSSGGLEPWGTLREPLFALDRADLQLFPMRRFSGFLTLEGKPAAVADIPGPVLAFCAIAHPEGFFSMLDEAGIAVSERLALRDHAKLSPEALKARLQRAADAGAKAFVTTAKDEVKLPAAFVLPLPGFILDIECHFSAVDEEKIDTALDEIFP